MGRTGALRFLILSICFFSDVLSSTPVPSLAPTADVGLPPQAAPVTYSPTLGNLDTEQKAIAFRIKAIAVMFSIAGLLFFLIIVHYVYHTLITKDWEKDNNDGVQTNKWEALEDQEERLQLLEDISRGIRKPENGVQWDDGVFEDDTLPRLEASWTKEHHFEMQWEDPEQNVSRGDRVLVCDPNRWVSEVPGEQDASVGDEEAQQHRSATPKSKPAPQISNPPVAGGIVERPTSVTVTEKRTLPPLEVSGPDAVSSSESAPTKENTAVTHKKKKVIRKKKT